MYESLSIRVNSVIPSKISKRRFGTRSTRLQEANEYYRSNTMAGNLCPNGRLGKPLILPTAYFLQAMTLAT